MKITSTKNRKVLSMAIFTVMLLSCLLTIQTASAAPWPYAAGTMPVPTPVDGRILPPNLTGDTSDWLEIARNGNYSLILRRNYINIYPSAVMSGKIVLNNPEWQYTAYGTNNDYTKSIARNKINEWFNGSNPVTNQADRLSWNARIRDYVMHSCAIATIGTGSTRAAMVNGFSRPTVYQVGIGNDMAFALSFAEAGSFLSRRVFMRDNYIGTVYSPEVPSNPIAAINYNKISIPTATNALYFMWLRSPGDTANTATTLENTQNAGSAGRVFQMYPTSQAGRNDRGLVYPALWVHQDIFSNNPNQPKPLPTPPYPVDGRILTPNLTGDVSDWVEIARSGNSSLIVRRNFINIYSVMTSGTKILYNDPAWQYTPYGANNNYLVSNVRTKINEWFNGTAPLTSQADRLPGFARLRNFTLQNNAVYVLGTGSTIKAVTDGFSMPSIYQQGIGPDVAFALSFGEAANFVSVQIFMRDFYIYYSPTYKVYAPQQPSNPFAVINYNKINIPTSASYLPYMWLRSPGESANSATTLENKQNAGSVGRVFSFGITMAAGRKDYGLIYPALWVNQGIFGTTATVIVRHLDAVDQTLVLRQDTHTVPAPGNYGPYLADNFPGYGAGYLAPGSAPASGTVNVNDTRTITYLYPRSQPTQVIYFPNGGTGNVSFDNVNTFTNYVVVDQGYTWAGMRQNGWNTQPDGTGTHYLNGDTIFVTAPVLLFAQWVPAGTSTIVLRYRNRFDSRELAASDDVHVIAPGPYGPYDSRDLRPNWITPQLAPESAPPSGVIAPVETRIIIWDYDRVI